MEMKNATGNPTQKRAGGWLRIGIWKRRAVWAVLVLGVAAGTWLWFGKKNVSSKANEPVKLTKPVRRDIAQYFRANGNIVPAVSTEIRSEVTGILAKIPVQSGDLVKGGQPLIELDQSEVKLKIAEMRLRIESARLRLEKMEGLYERRARLSARSFINEKELADAEIDARLARNELAAEEARLKTEEVQLSKASILAPYDGVVLDLQARPGLVVTGAQAGREGTTLLTIADLSRLKVEAEINEVDVASLRKGMGVKLTFDAAPGVSAAGTVDFISPSALSRRELSGTGERSGRSGGMERSGSVRNFPIDIGFRIEDPRIRPGMTAKMEAVLSEAKQVISVEIGAVFTEEGETVVYVAKGKDQGTVKEEELERKVVKTGVNDSRFVEIVEGLGDGEQVSLSKPMKKETREERNARRERKKSR
jgi:HlyD family secretion protein